MVLPLGLAHAQGGEGNDDGVVPEEGDDGDPANLHIELLFFGRVDFTAWLVELKEVAESSVVEIVGG